MPFSSLGRTVLREVLMTELHSRQHLIRSITASSLLIMTILLLSFTLSNSNLISDYAAKNLAPSAAHLFGTDWLGRDMLTRTVKGLRFSMMIGLVGSAIGVAVAAALGITAAAGGKKADAIILWLIDMFIGMPHLVFLILISFAAGRGARGIIIGVALTHWPVLARLVRNEVKAIQNLEYIRLSERFGKSRFFIVKNHLLPALLPQIMVGFLLLFPHAILHEASMTFLGFGLSAEKPSVGIILSEAVKHISLGHWWLAVFPGALLAVLVKSFDSVGEAVRTLIEPNPN